jgi:electron transfer flavoprotein alpha subunit
MRFNIINFFIDADAPIIQISNFSLIGDLFKVVPELTEKLKKLK